MSTALNSNVPITTPNILQKISLTSKLRPKYGWTISMTKDVAQPKRIALLYPCFFETSGKKPKGRYIMIFPTIIFHTHALPIYSPVMYRIIVGVKLYSPTPKSTLMEIASLLRSFTQNAARISCGNSVRNSNIM